MKPTDPELDSFLRTWGELHTPRREDLATVKRSILQQANLPATVVVFPKALQRDVSRSWLPMCSLACSLVLLCFFYGWHLNQTRKISANTNQVPFLEQMPAQHYQQITQDLQAMFGNRFTWAAETNDEISLGIESVSEQAAHEPYIAVRIIVLRRGHDEKRWQMVWTEDVVARAEALVQTTSAKDGTRLSLWTHLLPDGAMSIDTRLALRRDGEIPLTTTSVQLSNAPLRLLEMQRGTEDYQVWQTALILPEDAL